MSKVYIFSRLSLQLVLAIASINVLPVAGYACAASAVHDSTAIATRYHETKIKTEIDSILVVKKYRHMYAFNKGKLLKVYNVSLGENPVGPKHFKGDRKTPEGLYRIVKRNPYSMAHKSLAISYPNDQDRKYARTFGKDTGGDVMIHGILNGHEQDAADFVGIDWTWGCIAVTNEEVDELYEYVKMGSPINILP